MSAPTILDPLDPLDPLDQLAPPLGEPADDPALDHLTDAPTDGDPCPAPPQRELEVGETLTIAEVADRLGVTAHTLRYYERIGLVTVPRDRSGHRVYGSEEVARVVFITRLRLTAMPIRDIQTYFRLVAEGPGNEDERLAVLERHRDRVKAHLVELESALGVVEYKIAIYGGGATSP